MSDNLEHRRVEYASEGFTTKLAGADPMALFAAWYDLAATDPAIVEPNAMSLATVAEDGTPSNRMVLLKGIDMKAGSFRCFTNLRSRKAREALQGGVAALCWWWPGPPGREVRAVGRMRELDRDIVERYFATRPVAAQIGAAASQQSRAVENRASLEARIAECSAEPPAHAPDSWGGFDLHADELEFWQGRPGRVHDRISFLRLDEAGGICSRAGADAAGGEAHVLAVGHEVTDAARTRWLRLRLEP
ncbi:MAG: pyridoxal 5'-phosphate synthase [Gaiellales bacterium]